MHYLRTYCILFVLATMVGCASAPKLTPERVPVNAEVTPVAARTHQEGAAEPHAGSGSAPDGEETFYRHHVSVFLGGTHEESEEAFTVGLDYEYRLTELFGIGAQVDHTAEFDATLVAVGLHVHPVEPLAFFVAPGILIEDGDEKGVIRTGLQLEFPIDDRWTIGPTVNYDFIEGGEHAIDFGLALGVRF